MFSSMRNLTLAVCRKRHSEDWFSYVGKALGDRGFYFLPTVPDISANCRNSLSDSPDEFGWKWKVRQKLKLA